MSLPLYKLQQALYARFSGDGVLNGMVEGIYDTVPQQAAFPYIVIGDGRQEDLPASHMTSVRCTLDIELFSRSKGRQEVLLILERIYALLHRNVLSLDGYECIVTRCEMAQTEWLLDALTLRSSACAMRRSWGAYCAYVYRWPMARRWRVMCRSNNMKNWRRKMICW